jgi:prolyl-tRNA editing enzyme YbaK/EbsC (Cys-tRNA(Pro) deacylase)
MDRSFFVHEVVWIGAGSPSHMASIAPPELLRLSGARTVDLVGHG